MTDPDTARFLVLAAIAGVPCILLAGAFLAWGIGPRRYSRNGFPAKTEHKGIASTIVTMRGHRALVAPARWRDQGRP